MKLWKYDDWKSVGFYNNLKTVILLKSKKSMSFNKFWTYKSIQVQKMRVY